MASSTGFERRKWVPALGAALAWAGLALTGCGSNPFLTNWVPYPDTVTLYSASDSAPNLYDGYDFVNATRAVVEGGSALGTWDLAVGSDSTGLVWLPPDALGVASSAGIILESGYLYDDLTVAPGDTTLFRHTPVPIVVGVPYVLRTRKVTDVLGTTCSHYAKLEPLDVDTTLGRVRFVFEENPNCGDPRLTP